MLDLRSVLPALQSRRDRDLAAIVAKVPGRQRRSNDVDQRLARAANGPAGTGPAGLFVGLRFSAVLAAAAMVARCCSLL
jgi:hypothetical protein